MKIGDRVVHIKDGGVGHIERLDPMFADVRWLTPKNKPSCCVGICMREVLRLVPEHVIPMPRSEAGMAEAREFHEAIRQAIDGEDL